MTALAIPTEMALAVSGPPQGHWTHADWEALPDHDAIRYEVIDGVLYMTTAPSNFHQWIVKRLERLIGIPAEDQGLAITFSSPIGVLMPGCDPVQPDYVIVLSPNAGIIRDRRIRGVPDALVEVLSPSNAAYDEQIKLEAYERAGLPEYVIIDPRSRELLRYQRGADGAYGAPDGWAENESFAFACLPALSFRIGDLFAGAPDTTL